MPVHIETTSAMFSSVTRGFSAGWAASAAASAGWAPSGVGSPPWPDSSFSIFSRSLTSRSRSSAASSYCWAVIAASFSFCTASSPRSASLSDGGVVDFCSRTRLEASSIRSIALSGRKRSGM